MRAAVRMHAFPDRAALATRLAADVAGRLASAVARRGRAVLAVSGGTTPRLFLRTLAGASLDWRGVTVILADERCVPPASERSNARLVREHLLAGPAAAAVFVPLYDGSETDPVRAAELADAAYSRLGRIDACVLGMGTDGHTASFFPGASGLEQALDMRARRTVVAVAAPAAVEPRLTLALAPVARARFLALHIEGRQKRRVFEKARAPGPVLAMPVRAVLDRAGAGLAVYWAP